MSILKIGTNQSLNGTLVVPGDKSISHRALMMSCLIDGNCRVSNLNLGQDVLNTLDFMRSLGVKVDRSGHTDFALFFDVKYPDKMLNVWCGNSGTMVRLGMGVVSGIGVDVEFDGDESLRSRPMDRVIEPLKTMGARIDSQPKGRLPVGVMQSKLHGISYSLPTPSAQVKSSLMFAGVNASGVTEIFESKTTRRHTEELFTLTEIEFEEKEADSGHFIKIEGPVRPTEFSLNIPCDPSQAAFFITGALITKNSDVRLENVYLGKERTGFLRVLERMKANVNVYVTSTEPFPVGILEARSSELVATDIQPYEVADMIDEIPILAVCAANASGVSRFMGLAELRVKETDRILTICELLKSFGVDVAAEGDDLIIAGRPKANPNRIAVGSCLDHRIAMSAAIFAVGLQSKDSFVEIRDFDCVSTSYNGFLDDLRILGVVDG